LKPFTVAHRFAAGHRIRLQVCSGAHPRYVRNPGTGEHPLAAESLHAVDVEILHGPVHPLSVVLPIASRGAPGIDGAVDAAAQR
jgi:predicted acyl esterase